MYAYDSDRFTISQIAHFEKGSNTRLVMIKIKNLMESINIEKFELHSEYVSIANHIPVCLSENNEPQAKTIFK